MSKLKDFATNPPKNKTVLDKESMLDYVLNHKTKEEQKWFVELLDNNKKIKKNNLDGGKEYEGYDLAIIREEFAKRFFPDISEKGRAKARPAKKQNTFEDKLEQLRKSLESK